LVGEWGSQNQQLAMTVQKIEITEITNKYKQNRLLLDFFGFIVNNGTFKGFKL